MRLLLSYHYFRRVDVSELVGELEHLSGQSIDIMVDSGAFSAFTLGSVIDLDAYAEWVRYWGKYFTAYANLDVIGDPRATKDNQRALEAKGLAPLPIFHTGEPWEYLDGYLEAYPYIMLGGMVPYSKEKKRLMPWLIKCFKKAEGRAVYHGLGLTSSYSLTTLPWYSVDSSSWAAGVRYGDSDVFDQRLGKMKSLALSDSMAWQREADVVRALGFNPADCIDKSRTTRRHILSIAFASWQAMEDWVRKRMGVTTMPGSLDTGIKLYLAAGALSDLRLGSHGVRIYLANSNVGNFKDAAKGINREVRV